MLACIFNRAAGAIVRLRGAGWKCRALLAWPLDLGRVLIARRIDLLVSEDLPRSSVFSRPSIGDTFRRFLLFHLRSGIRVNTGFIKLLVGLHPIGTDGSIA